MKFYQKILILVSIGFITGIILGLQIIMQKNIKIMNYETKETITIPQSIVSKDITISICSGGKWNINIKK